MGKFLKSLPAKLLLGIILGIIIGLIDTGSGALVDLIVVRH